MQPLSQLDRLQLPPQHQQPVEIVLRRVDLPTKRQKAISPKLLRHMYSFAKGGGDNVNFITAQLAIGGFFFAMRSCEQVKTPVRRTR
jgi:hypothetical protein